MRKSAIFKIKEKTHMHTRTQHKAHKRKKNKRKEEKRKK